MTDVSDFSMLRDAVVATLAAAIPNVSVEAHGGTFDLEEIKRYAALAPAIRVAVVGCGRAYRWNDGRWLVPVNFAAVCVARDLPSADRTKIVGRDAAAMLLATAVGLAVQGNRFGLSGVRQPEDVMARNEYSGRVDQTGLALWQVTWTSGAALGASVNEAIAAIVQVLAQVDGSTAPPDVIYPASAP